MIFYIILHCLQEYKAFLIIFSKKIFMNRLFYFKNLKKCYHQNAHRVTNFELENGLDTSWGKICNITTMF